MARRLLSSRSRAALARSCTASIDAALAAATSKAGLPAAAFSARRERDVCLSDKGIPTPLPPPPRLRPVLRLRSREEEGEEEEDECGERGCCTGEGGTSRARRPSEVGPGPRLRLAALGAAWDEAAR